MRPDPPIPPGGGCAQCGQPRRPERSLQYAKHAAERDSFCSTECCREWHGTTPKQVTDARYCLECAGPVGEVSPGCRTCADRLKKRERRAA